MTTPARPEPATADQPTDRLIGLLNLLVIDDDPVQRMLIAAAAEKAGYGVTQAGSCAEGIEALRSQAFSCVTLDLALEDGDGTDVLKAMAEERYVGPVIVISGMSAERRSACRTLARSLGMELLHSFPKPIDLAALRISLANLRSSIAGLPVMHSWGEVCGPRFETGE
jgi:two-component system, chemotaxis family, chemotaxis protein CheY